MPRRSEHYRAAEGGLGVAQAEPLGGAQERYSVSFAQVQATLAVADALAELHATVNEALGEIRDELAALRPRP